MAATDGADAAIQEQRADKAASAGDGTENATPDAATPAAIDAVTTQQKAAGDTAAGTTSEKVAAEAKAAAAPVPDATTQTATDRTTAAAANGDAAAAAVVEPPKPRGIKGVLQRLKEQRSAAETKRLEQIRRDYVVPTDDIQEDSSGLDIFKLLHPQPTAEELRRQEQRYQRDRDFAALSDALDALSEMTTSKGHAYTPRTTRTDKAQERYDKWKEQQKAIKQAYFENYLKQRTADEDLQIKRAKANYDLKLKALDIEYRQGRMTLQEYKTKEAEIEAEMKRDEILSRINRNNRVPQAKSGTTGKPYGHITVAGEEREYATQADYRAALETLAGEYGIPTTYQEESGFGKTTTKRRTDAQIQADIERKSQAAASANADGTATKASPTAGKSKASPTKK
jgi:hypothetical protein